MEQKERETQGIQEVIQLLTEIKNSVMKKEPNTQRKELMNNEEMMEFLGVSRRTLQKYRDEGVLSFIQIKDKIYYKYVDVEEYLNRNLKKPLRNDSIKRTI